MKDDAIWILWRSDSQFSADFCMAWFASPGYDGLIPDVYDDAIAYCMASV
jgi:hypothetical protein